MKPTRVWTILVNRCAIPDRCFLDHDIAMENLEPNDEIVLASEISEPELVDRVKWLEIEVSVLRQYGNRDCTAMADEVLEEKRHQEKFKIVRLK